MGEEGTEGEWRGRGGEEEEEGSAVYSCLALASEPHFPKWEMSPYCLGLPRRLTRPCSIALGLVPAVGFNKWLLLLLIISTIHSFREKKNLIITTILNLYSLWAMFIKTKALWWCICWCAGRRKQDIVSSLASQSHTHTGLLTLYSCAPRQSCGARGGGMHCQALSDEPNTLLPSYPAAAWVQGGISPNNNPGVQMMDWLIN